MMGSLSKEQIEELLHSEVVARLGCHAEGRTYVVPITYAYDNNSIVGHSVEGMKIRMMRENPWVCVEIERTENLANWRSVIAWGRFEELVGTAATAAWAILRERFRGLTVSTTSEPPPGTAHGRPGNGHACVYRIHLSEKTGRFERQSEIEHQA
jgi:nitroimidazol reductase NimA-like FMN-containing flavoprotein (pyridoxamine 5'-phosphate oxidase superfamily)